LSAPLSETVKIVDRHWDDFEHYRLEHFRLQLCRFLIQFCHAELYRDDRIDRETLSALLSLTARCQIREEQDEYDDEDDEESPLPGFLLETVIDLVEERVTQGIANDPTIKAASAAQNQYILRLYDELKQVKAGKSGEPSIKSES